MADMICHKVYELLMSILKTIINLPLRKIVQILFLRPLRPYGNQNLGGNFIVSTLRTFEEYLKTANSGFEET
jgi:hypothetical protein